MLLQRVTIGIPEGQQTPDPKNSSGGMTNKPKAFNMSIIESYRSYD